MAVYNNVLGMLILVELKNAFRLKTFHENNNIAVSDFLQFVGERGVTGPNNFSNTRTYLEQGFPVGR